MRYLPKLLRDFFKPAELPPDANGRAPMEDRIAVAAAKLGDRMVAAEARTVATMTARVEPLFADFARQIEDRK